MSRSTAGSVAGTSTLSTVGAWAATVRLEDIPDAAIRTAKRSILDTLGVTVAALDEPIVGVLDRWLASSSGTATVIGTVRPVDPEQAALANGALAHALDFDDVSHTMGGHPSVPVLSAVLAVAEAEGSSGADVLLAYCIGVEVATKIARGLNFHHYDWGWHPTATLGIFGSTAAAARLMGLGAERTTTALAIATAFSSGIKASFGTMTKPIQAGRAAQGGVQAAGLARAGGTSDARAMDAPQGFANVFNGPGNHDLAEVTAHLGSPWDLEDPGLAIKLHPCCGGTHAAVDAAIELHQELGGSGDIVSARAMIHERRFRHLDRPEPKGPLDAKFSLQHVVALALEFGEIRIDHFDDAESLEDPRITGLRDRITVAALPPELEGPEHYAGEVHVELQDGSRRMARMERPRGRLPETALTDEDIEAKFERCTDRFIDAAGRSTLIDAVRGLADLQDLREVMTILRHSRPVVPRGTRSGRR